MGYLDRLRTVGFEVAAAKFKIDGFVWFKYNGAKAVGVKFGDEKIALRPGDRFGALEIERGANKDMMRIVFEKTGLDKVTYISLEGGDKLLDRSRKIKTPTKLNVEVDTPPPVLKPIVKPPKIQPKPVDLPVAPPKVKPNLDDLLKPHSNTSSLPMSEGYLPIRFSEAAFDDKVKVPYLKELWELYNRTKFQGQMKMPNISLMKDMGDKMRKRAYWVGGSARKLVVSPRLFNDMKALFEVFLHEMCHQAVSEISKLTYREPNQGHGPVWQSWMVKVGLDPNRFDTRDNDAYMTDSERLESEAKKQIKDLQTKDQISLSSPALKDTTKYFNKGVWTYGIVVGTPDKKDRFPVFTMELPKLAGTGFIPGPTIYVPRTWLYKLTDHEEKGMTWQFKRQAESIIERVDAENRYAKANKAGREAILNEMMNNLKM